MTVPDDRFWANRTAVAFDAGRDNRSTAGPPSRLGQRRGCPRFRRLDRMIQGIDHNMRSWMICLGGTALWALAGCGPSDEGATSNAVPESPPPASPLSSPEAAAPYPLATCIVSGESLDDHGEPFVLEHSGREVRFCCRSCGEGFLRNPTRFLEKLDRLAGTAAELPGTAP